MKKNNRFNKLKTKDKKLRDRIRKTKLNQRLRRQVTHRLDQFSDRQSTFIQAEDGEKLLQYRQNLLRKNVSLTNASQIFDLDLQFGTYSVKYSREGRHMLLSSDMGHASLMRWKDKHLLFETHLSDPIRSAVFLHDGFIALAQSANCFIYDFEGQEVHDLVNVPEPMFVDYLPWHYLMASVSRYGMSFGLTLGKLTYLDVSTGELKSAIKTGIRSACSMTHNPQNAAISIGSPKGMVSVFVPSQPQAAVKINCHNAQVRAHGYSSCGKYLATVGSDSSVKIWDIRRTFQQVAEYFSPFPVASMDISQKNIMALGGKASVLMFNHWTRQAPGRAEAYLKHVDHKRRRVNSVGFVPYEDFLGVGMEGAFSSILVPGSCHVEFDSFTHNVQGIKRQTRENAVHKLLEKLPMESIVLNPAQIGRVDPTARDVLEREKEQEKRERAEQKIRQRKRKKRSKIQAFRFKEMQRDEILRNRIRDDKFARKELYKAEEKKRLAEGKNLDSRLGDYVKMGREESTRGSVWGVTSRQNGARKAQKSGRGF